MGGSKRGYGIVRSGPGSLLREAKTSKRRSHRISPRSDRTPHLQGVYRGVNGFGKLPRALRSHYDYEALGLWHAKHSVRNGRPDPKAQMTCEQIQEGGAQREQVKAQYKLDIQIINERCDTEKADHEAVIESEEGC